LCNEAYCIDLDQDQPPGPLWKLLPEREPNVRSLRLLHMVPLLEQIERQVRQQRAAAHITLPDGATLPRDLATVLLSSWLHPPQRSDARETARGVVHVVLGLREIHALLSGVTTPQAEEAPTTASPELRILDGQADKKQSFARTLGFVGERDEEADIWDMVYTVRPREQVKSWSEVEVARSYTLVRGDLVNRSSGGFGLRFPAGRLGAVRDGDLVAVSTSEDTGDWSLGMVRWLHVAADGSIELGIKQLQQHVVPAAIRVEQEGQQSAPIDCLLGHAQEQLRVVLPCMTGLANKRLLLTSGGREIPISLFEPLEFSTVFQMFRCVENQARRAPSEAKPQAAADPFDKYKSVWEIL
jgi:hypothetical protein